MTVAFGQVYYFIAYRWSNVTGGEDGFSISRPHLFGPQSDQRWRVQAYYYYVLVIFVAVMAFLWFLVRSPFGLSLRAISQNEVRVRYLAINSDRMIFKALVHLRYGRRNRRFALFDVDQLRLSAADGLAPVR